MRINIWVKVQAEVWSKVGRGIRDKVQIEVRKEFLDKTEFNISKDLIRNYKSGG